MKQLEEILGYSLISYGKLDISVGTIVSLLVILLVLSLGLRGIKYLLNKTLTAKSTSNSQARVHRLYQLVKYIAYIAAIGISIETLGFDLTLILGASAALLVGIGLGLQEVFKDIFSGIVLLVEGIFQVGDVIELEGMVGQVKQIDLRTSKIETRDGTYVILPNSNLVNEKLINWSINRKETRFNVSVGVAYGSDTELVTSLLKECALNHPKISKNEPIWVKFEDFGDSALVFKLYFWTSSQWDIEQTRSELRYRIDKAFRNNKVTIPFPQRDLHIKNELKVAESKISN